MHFRDKVKADRPLQSRSSELQMALESDRGRIITSAAVRRLQQKTQVFPLERNAAVRSRLTHSLEVQQTGRFIVQSLFRQLGEAGQADYGLTGLERPIETLVEMACLLHDIGNPPFGHSGEEAINRWFSANLPAPSLTSAEAENLWLKLATELCQFEGNAQAIRLVYSLQQMNLTYTQVATILKYTRPATEAAPEKAQPLSYLRKKPGFYYAEQAFVQQLQQHLQLAEHCRHPLSYVMEAADDISYCLADIEDAVEKGLLSLSALVAHLNQTFAELEPQNRPLTGLYGKTRSFADIVQQALADAQADPVLSANSEFFIRLRVGIIHPLVSYAASQFIANIEQVYHGSLNRALLEDDSQYHAVTRTFKQVARRYVFSHSEVETLELQGFRIISGLLDTFKPLLQLPAEQFAAVISAEGAKGYPVENRLARKLAPKHVAAYRSALARSGENDSMLPVLELYYRCRLLQDHISGMTDHFAFDEYQTLVNCRAP